jgi:hypothetical protein
LPDFEVDPGQRFVERLVVTRRIVRACARFTDEGQLEPTGPGPEPPGEPDVPVIFEDLVAEGVLEHELLARAGGSENPQRGQQLIADQRNRFMRRVTQSMVSGFTAGSYQPRTFVETSTARSLTGVALRRSTRSMDDLVAKGLLTEQERSRLGTIDTVGELFDPSIAILDDAAGTRARLIRQVRTRVADFVMQPATG